jgi:hypothetical protein
MVGLLIFPASARGDDDPYGSDDEDPYADLDADVQFKAGLDKMMHHDLEEACPQIKKSYELEPRPGTLFTHAECEAQRGHTATAVDEFTQFESLVKSLPQVKQLKYKTRKEKAEQRRAEIEPSVPKITITLPPEAPWRTEITMLKIQPEPRSKSEAAPLPVKISLDTLDSPRLLDPGSYIFTVQAQGGKPAETRAAFGKFEKRTIALKIAPAEKACTSSSLQPSAVVVSPNGGACGRCAVGSHDDDAGAGMFVALCALAGLSRRRRRRPLEQTLALGALGDIGLRRSSNAGTRSPSPSQPRNCRCSLSAPSIDRNLRRGKRSEVPLR